MDPRIAGRLPYLCSTETVMIFSLDHPWTAVSAAIGDLDAFIDLVDRLLNQAYGLITMACFVRVSLVQLGEALL
jgi:hypothetical protein